LFAVTTGNPNSSRIGEYLHSGWDVTGGIIYPKCGGIIFPT